MIEKKHQAVTEIKIISNAATWTLEDTVNKLLKSGWKVLSTHALPRVSTSWPKESDKTEYVVYLGFETEID